MRIEYANNVVTEVDVRRRTGARGAAAHDRAWRNGPEDTTFTYDAMRMLLSQSDAAPGGQGSRSFAYDPLYQLKRADITENGAPVTRDYQYTNHWNLSRLDEAGPRLSLRRCRASQPYCGTDRGRDAAAESRLRRQWKPAEPSGADVRLQRKERTRARDRAGRRDGGAYRTTTRARG